MSIGRGFSALAQHVQAQHVQEAPSIPRTFGRGRARFSNPCLDDDETSMALLRRQLQVFCETPPTPETPTVQGQFADSVSESGTASPGNTSGTVTPRRRPRSASETSSSLPSTPRSAASNNFRGDDDPDCVCYREKKQVICRMCGEAYRGRVRKKCSVHCNVRMLMDNDLCAKCGIPCLMEYDQDGAYDRE